MQVLMRRCAMTPIADGALGNLLSRRLHVGPAASRPENHAQTSKAGTPPVTPKHWLDQRFPGAREWLEAKNRRWWLKGLTAWCR